MPTGREEFLQHLELRRKNDQHSRSFSWTFRDQFDSQGQRLCVWCGTHLPPGKRRKRWCGDGCVNQFRTIKGDMSYIRTEMLKRDKGVCRACGVDTETLKKVLWQDLEFFGKARQHSPEQVRKFYERWWKWLNRKQKQQWEEMFNSLDYTALCLKAAMWLRDWLARRSFWAADHIVEVQDGGFGCDMNNMQTLCNVCHNLKTQSEKRRRKG